LSLNPISNLPDARERRNALLLRFTRVGGTIARCRPSVRYRLLEAISQLRLRGPDQSKDKSSSIASKGAARTRWSSA
jgi:hypothetical protein